MEAVTYPNQHHQGVFVQRVVLRPKDVKMEIQRDFVYGISHSKDLVSDIGFVTQFRPKAWDMGITDIVDLLHREHGILITIVFKVMKESLFKFVKLEMGGAEQTQARITYGVLGIHGFDARTKGFFLVLVIKDGIAAFGFQSEREGVGHRFLPSHIMPFHFQAVAVLNENKEILVVNRTCENGRGLNNGKKHPFPKQPVGDTVVAQ